MDSAVSAFNYIARHAIRWSSTLEDLSISNLNGVSPMDDTVEASIMMENIEKKDLYRLLVQKDDQPGLETNEDYLEFITKRILMDEAESIALQKRPAMPPPFFPLNYQLQLHNQASPVRRYSSLFNSHFITFTGKGHQIISLPESAEAMRCFAKEAVAMTTALETSVNEEIEDNMKTIGRKKKVTSPRKRHCVDKSCERTEREEEKEETEEEDVFTSIYQTIRQYEHVLQEWETATNEQVRNELRGKLESLKTAIVTSIATDGSYSYIANNQDMFNAENTFGVMHDAFSNLLIYLHNTIPGTSSYHSHNGNEERKEGQTLLDQYFMTVVAAVRLYYVYAIQTACVVINMITLREQRGK